MDNLKELKEKAKKIYDDAVKQIAADFKNEESAAKQFEADVISKENEKIKAAKLMVSNACDNVEKRFRLEDLNAVQQEANKRILEVKIAVQKRIQFAKETETNQLNTAKIKYNESLLNAKEASVQSDESQVENESATSTSSDSDSTNNASSNNTDIDNEQSSELSSSDVNDNLNDIGNNMEEIANDINTLAKELKDNNNDDHTDIHLDELLSDIPTVNDIIPETKSNKTTFTENSPLNINTDIPTYNSSNRFQGSNSIIVILTNYQRNSAIIAERCIRNMPGIRINLSTSNANTKSLFCEVASNINPYSSFREIPNVIDIICDNNTYVLRFAT